MKRVAEIIYIVKEEREAFLNSAMNLTNEEEQVLWKCGVRNQQYFALNDLIFMTFEYKGDDFSGDMNRMAAYLESKGLLVTKRRRDVPADELDTTNWWAPVKKLGTLLTSRPSFNAESDVFDCYFDGEMMSREKYDIAFDEDDWSESMHF